MLLGLGGLLGGLASSGGFMLLEPRAALPGNPGKGAQRTGMPLPPPPGVGKQWYGGASLPGYALTPEDMYGWGWRVPYLVVFLPGIWSAANTHRLQEAPEYTPPPAEVSRCPGCSAGHF